MNDVPPGERMRQTLARQRAAQRAEGVPDHRTRIDRLERLAMLLRENEAALCESLQADFGQRSLSNAAMTEIAYPISAIRYAQKHLRAWMKDEPRKVALLPRLLGARARVRHQPLGVIGVISPWNFPVNLAVAPLTDILAAGNRAMVKPSEHTPRNSALLAELVARYFSDEEVAVFPGGLEAGEAFARLPFDHLVFTGAGSIARHVARAASENLVPLTLELGGKSPVIVSRELPFDLDRLATCIIDFKMSNAGQICIAPDYLFVPEEKLREVIEALRKAVTRLYPRLLENPDYTAIINERHLARLQGYREAAAASGAEIIELNPASEDFSHAAHRKMPPCLVINPADGEPIMRNEIFGPLLPIRTYRDINEESTSSMVRAIRSRSIILAGPAAPSSSTCSPGRAPVGFRSTTLRPTPAARICLSVVSVRVAWALITVTTASSASPMRERCTCSRRSTWRIFSACARPTAPGTGPSSIT